MGELSGVGMYPGECVSKLELTQREGESGERECMLNKFLLSLSLSLFLFLLSDDNNTAHLRFPILRIKFLRNSFVCCSRTIVYGVVWCGVVHCIT